MKQITGIAMASTNDIYKIVTGNNIIIQHENDGTYSIYIDSEILEDNISLMAEARAQAINWAIDDDLVITGYGRSSGRKFWQLPAKLQDQIRAYARRAK